MRYSEYQPPAKLAGIVEIIWVFSGTDTDVQRIVPDGRCELVIHCGTPYREFVGQTWRRQASALFAGQLTRPLHLQGQGAVTAISARFAPGAASTFLYRDASILTDRRSALEEIDPAAGSLPQAMRLAASDAERVERLSAYIETRCALSPLTLDRRIARAVAILDRVEAASIGGIAADLSLSIRQFERLFRRSVGVSPKLYGSIVRFRRIFDDLSEGRINWSDAAVGAGYSDHPQMAREFQRFVGCSATQFLRERAQLAAAMTRSRAMSS